MSDQSSQPGNSELAQPAIGANGNSNDVELDPELDLAAIGDGSDATPGDGTDAGDQELDDLEFGFKKWRVPKELSEGVKKLNATFTQKSQELSTLASKSAELEAREARIAEQSKLTDEEVQTRVHLKQIKSSLEQYEKLTEAQWAEMKDANYEAWNEHRQNVIILKSARAEAEGKLSEHETKRTQSAEQDYVTRIQQTQAFATKLPGWKPELDKQIVEFALSKGFKPEEVHRNMSPAIYDTLRLARIGAAVEKQQAARAKAAAAEAPTDPLEMVGTKRGAPPVGLDDRLSAEEWVKRRNKQVAKAH